MVRSVVAIIVLALALVACGGDDVTLTEYVDLINAAANEAGQRAEELTSAGVLGADVNPEQLQAGMERGLAEIRRPLQSSVEAIEPPDQVAELHTLLWSWHAEFIATETALAVRIGQAPDTEQGWTDLSNSPEMAAYRASVAEGKRVCIDFQTTLDATAARGEFDDVAWLPSELSEVVTAALGCEWFPEDPDSIYQYPLP